MPLLAPARSFQRPGPVSAYVEKRLQEGEPIEEGSRVFETKHRFVIFNIVLEEKLVDIVHLPELSSASTAHHVTQTRLSGTSFWSFRSIVTHSKPSSSGYGSLGTLAGSSGSIGPSSDAFVSSSNDCQYKTSWCFTCFIVSYRSAGLAGFARTCGSSWVGCLHFRWVAPLHCLIPGPAPSWIWGQEAAG